MRRFFGNRLNNTSNQAIADFGVGVSLSKPLMISDISISDCGLRIAELKKYPFNPKSLIHNPKFFL
ncbi:hypothetical protein HYR99_01325 [Candidatus Poribacteria bacterium]|nr:hypothetical protein [Candidatus Poribacteria bacterium]